MQEMQWEDRPDETGTLRARPVMRVEDIVVPEDEAGPLVTEAFLFSQGNVDIAPDPWAWEQGMPGLRFTPA